MAVLSLILFALALGLSLVATPAVRRVALRVSFVDRPGGRKTHDRQIAYGGGAAVLLACSTAGLVAALAVRDPGWVAARLSGHLPGASLPTAAGLRGPRSPGRQHLAALWSGRRRDR